MSTAMTVQICTCKTWP